MSDVPESSSADDLVRYSFLVLFAKDRIIDEDEFSFVERLALRDGVIDDEEREVLGAIFERVDLNAMDPDVLEEIEEFKALFDIE